ncbi:kinase-like domain-containing protein [Mycena amicta]|nr:kinase-like domain-containing protein [Mycena amicta]
MSISSGHGDTEYNGWVSTVIEPLDEFIDRHVNPRQLFHRLRKIAEGSSGSVVYEARLGDDDDMDTHPAAPSFVAIKSVPIVPGPGGVNAKMGEILRNVKLMQRIPPSEHILRLDALYVDSVDDALWIQMGFMNRSLASVISLIERGLRLSDRVIAGCAKDILTALEHLRTCDIAVANLSSRNIFINNDGFVKLGNFSAAVELSTDPTDHKRARYISKYVFAPVCRRG